MADSGRHQTFDKVPPFLIATQASYWDVTSIASGPLVLRRQNCWRRSFETRRQYKSTIHRGFDRIALDPDSWVVVCSSATTCNWPMVQPMWETNVGQSLGKLWFSDFHWFGILIQTCCPPDNFEQRFSTPHAKQREPCKCFIQLSYKLKSYEAHAEYTPTISGNTSLLATATFFETIRLHWHPYSNSSCSRMPARILVKRRIYWVANTSTSLQSDLLRAAIWIRMADGGWHEAGSEPLRLTPSGFIKMATSRLPHRTRQPRVPAARHSHQSPRHTNERKQGREVCE